MLQSLVVKLLRSNGDLISEKLLNYNSDKVVRELVESKIRFPPETLVSYSITYICMYRPSHSACNLNLNSPWSSRWCVGLKAEKPGFEPQARHQNKIRKVFRRRFPLSRFLAKTLRVNKIAMKSFSKKSVVRIRL